MPRLSTVYFGSPNISLTNQNIQAGGERFLSVLLDRASHGLAQGFLVQTLTLTLAKRRSRVIYSVAFLLEKRG